MQRTLCGRQILNIHLSERDVIYVPFPVPGSNNICWLSETFIHIYIHPDVTVSAQEASSSALMGHFCRFLLVLPSD